MLDKKFKLHPGCRNISLTHLFFADDLMVCVEGSKKSIEGALKVFDVFEVWSGLRISLEKSTIYMAGVSEVERSSILTDFPFAVGELPVRYLSSFDDSSHEKTGLHPISGNNQRQNLFLDV